MKKSNDIDGYIKKFPKEVQPILRKVRAGIKRAAPKAEETISYGIPTFKLQGNLVHFGGFKKHIGFFPTPQAIIKFKKELMTYKKSKGTVQFLLSEPIPVGLIYKITKFRVIENLKKKIK